MLLSVSVKPDNDFIKVTTSYKLCYCSICLLLLDIEILKKEKYIDSPLASTLKRLLFLLNSSLLYIETQVPVCYPLHRLTKVVGFSSKTESWGINLWMSENPKELLCTFSLYKKIIIGNDAGTIINQSISIHSGKIFFIL